MKRARTSSSKRTAAAPVGRAATKRAPQVKRATPAGRTVAKRAPVTRPMTRADFGKPIAGFFAKQPKALRPLLEELRDLIHETVPDAESSLKWGMPFFTIAGSMMCALGGHKAHVNLILPGPPGTYADPEGRLTGEAKTGRHLKLTAGETVPRDAVRGWIKTAAARARDDL